LNTRTNVISHQLVTYNLDLLAVTETWLSAECSNSDLLNVCPAGYSAVHTARLGKRGGGVALIYRDSIRVDVVTSGFSCNSFEHMVTLLRFNSISIRLVIVYRPPSQSSKCSEGQFISDFADFLQLLVVSTV
jgi:exonuclease III